MRIPHFNPGASDTAALGGGGREGQSRGVQTAEGRGPPQAAPNLKLIQTGRKEERGQIGSVSIIICDWHSDV